MDYRALLQCHKNNSANISAAISFNKNLKQTTPDINVLQYKEFYFLLYDSQRYENAIYLNCISFYYQMFLLAHSNC